MANSAVIERREYKYLIDHDMAEAVRTAIAPFCELDPYAARSVTRNYNVETLYLDTPALSLFWANDAEQLDRVKVRVRTYPNAPSAPVFFEVKRRFNDVVSKSRGRVPRALWSRLLTDPSPALARSLGVSDSAGIERFLAFFRAHHLQPFTLVRYAREPYVSRIDDYARVTLDTRVHAQVQPHFSFEAEAHGWRSLDDAVAQRTAATHSMVVLELKFTNRVPLWMIHVARRLGLVREAFSKYGTSIRAFYQLVDQRTPAHARGWR